MKALDEVAHEKGSLVVKIETKNNETSTIKFTNILMKRVKEIIEYVNQITNKEVEITDHKKRLWKELSINFTF